MNANSVYWAPWHRRPQDNEYMLQLQPAVVKIMDGGPPDYQWVRLNLPGALIVARDWALSEQKSDMLGSPDATGKRHAQEWAQKQAHLGFDPNNTLVLGINEPAVWQAGVIDALVVYTVAFLDECTRLNLRGGALQLSVGWPANHGQGQPPDWAPYAPVEAAIRRNPGHALILHEYWATNGPGDGWGWYAGRFLHCPWQVPIVIGECGLDMGVVQDPATLPGNRGWQGNVSAAQYGAQVEEYLRRAQGDARFYAATVFLTDYQDVTWQSFDTEPARNELLNATQGMVENPWFVPGSPPQPEPGPEPEPPTPGVIELAHPLPAGSYRITQDFYEQEASGYGSQGHDGTDFGASQGTPVFSMAAGVVAWADYDAAYGNYVRIYHEALEACTFYAHLVASYVTAGDVVAQGEVIGVVGSTGNSTGAHLHLSVRSMLGDDYNPAAPMAKGCIDPRSWAALFGLDLATGASYGGATTTYLPIVSG